MKYAQGTSVTAERSRSEIEYVLGKFGADQFGYAMDKVSKCAKLWFRYKGAHFLFRLPMADANDKAVKFTASGRLRVSNQVEQIIGDENARRWRSLRTVIKSMLVGVEDGILNFAEIFMPYMVWGDGRTTADTLLPTVEECLGRGGALPALTEPSRMLESSAAQEAGK